MQAAVLTSFFLSTVFACGPGGIAGDDSEWSVTLAPVNPPVQFVYTSSALNDFSAPRSAAEAIRNIETFTRNIITTQMRQYIPETLYLPASMVSSIIQDFEIKVAQSYIPLECANFVNGVNFGSATTVAPTVDGRDGNWCIYNDEWVINSYCRNVTGSANQCPKGATTLPIDYTRIPFLVTPGTGVLSYQPRRFWNNFMKQVVSALQTSTYASAFQNVDFTIARST